MRCRHVRYRYTALVGDLPSSVAAELRSLLRPQAIAPAIWRPLADVVETAAALRVTLEIAGVDEADLEIALFADALVVTGRRGCARCDGARWHESEIRYGPFRFELLLPTDVDPERVDASYDRGLLRIVLPKLGGAA